MGEFFVLYFVIFFKSSAFETQNPKRTEPGLKALPNCAPKPNGVPLASWRNSWNDDSFSLALLSDPAMLSIALGEKHDLLSQCTPNKYCWEHQHT